MALGSGTVTAGAESTLAGMFADRAAVYLEIQVGTETLTPRVQVLASAYAQNAGTLQGNAASAFALAGHMQTPAAGGTGLNTSATAAGSVLYTNGTGTWAALPPGADRQVLQLSSGLPQWGAPTGGNADMVDGYHAGNSSGTVAINNAILNATLNADEVDGIHASTTATANMLLPLDASAKIANARLYTGAANGLDADLLDGQHGAYYQTATNINAGTLADARLSSNVGLLSGTQTFSGAKTFSGGISWSGTAGGSADMVDGYHAGNASGQVPVSNGTLNTNLNADLLDGQHGAYYQNATNINAGALASARGGTGLDTSAAAAGSMLYTSGTGAWSVLGPGSNGQVLQVASGLPQWGTASGGNADTVDGYHAGNASGQVPVSNSTVNTNLNADVLDGYHAGNASGQVPVSNSTLNSNLNADLLDGQHGSYYLTATNINAGTLADARLSSNVALLGGTQTFSGSKTFSANTTFPGSGLWDTSGRVGIGTTSLSYPLTIQGSQAVAQLITTSSTYGSVLELKNSMASPGYVGAINFNDAANSYPGQIVYDGSNNMTFRTAGSEHMRIASSGEVGIGTTSTYNAGLSVWGPASGSGYAFIGLSDTGVSGYGVLAGGHFIDTDSGGTAYVGYGTYKIYGGGTVAFVQNHPADKGKVIVYAAPEGDEVATYTRGTAKLSNGEARVSLGPTFKWVTNPDIGLTAHVTPKTKDGVLYVESVNPSELVVKSVTGFAPDATFDYLVYGLRIGFEEISIVQEKQQESYIPSFKDHRDRYAKYPDLRAYNSLERFKGMESSAGLRASFDFSAAKALHDAIHEYDPATDPPVDQLFGFRHGQPPTAPAKAVHPASASPSQPARSTAQAASASVKEPTPGNTTVASIAPESKSDLPCFPVLEAVEAGEVVTMDLARKGYVHRCALSADPLVVGIAAGDCETRNEKRETLTFPAIEGEGDVSHFAVDVLHNVPVVVGGITQVKVDAAYGAIHEGDLLIASPTPGHAMKMTAFIPGTVIGKALESLEAGTGMIKVLVMLR